MMASSKPGGCPSSRRRTQPATPLYSAFCSTARVTESSEQPSRPGDQAIVGAVTRRRRAAIGFRDDVPTPSGETRIAERARAAEPAGLEPGARASDRRRHGCAVCRRSRAPVREPRLRGQYSGDGRRVGSRRAVHALVQQRAPWQRAEVAPATARPEATRGASSSRSAWRRPLGAALAHHPRPRGTRSTTSSSTTT